MHSIYNVEGRTYGPFQFSVTPESRAAFIRATTDDADRWLVAAPPGYASVALFLTAPAFFADPDVQSVSAGVIHADQSFTWHRPWIDGRYTASGTVNRVRERRGAYFITLTTTVLDVDGEAVVDSVSSFLMAEGSTTDPASEEAEPLANHRANNDYPSDGGAFLKSASRSDLVKYAAATNDFNEIHWDHSEAVAAGLPGVVVHGLLMANWMYQAGSELADGDLPLHASKVRFRAPLRPAEQAEVVTTIGDDGAVSTRLSAGGTLRASAFTQVT
jgi:hydroxyacyl-ACP dehydratase HTD2-like protein with hotdog domain